MLIIVFLATVALLLGVFCIQCWTNPLHKLPGPPVRGFFGSHLKHISGAQSGFKVYDFLNRRYGRNVRVRGAFPWEERVLTMDPVAMTHILKNSDLYQKPALSRRLITSLIGCGMLSAEGHVYQRQKRVLQPAFSNHNLRGFVPLVLKKSIQLKHKWINTMKAGDDAESATLDISRWINRVTFDVMGLAGFDYNFNAVEDESNELLQAYMEMFSKCATPKGLFALLRVYSPVIGWLFPDSIARRCRATIHRIAGRVIQEKKQKLAHDLKNGHLQSGNDLLTFMLQSNADPALPPEARISEGDLLDNINTLMFAGSDTSSVSITWTLVLLAQNPTIQDRLREELLAVIPQNTSLDELSDEEGESLNRTITALPILNKVLRESLRLIPPLHSSLRVATQTDEVPTAQVDGKSKASFTVPKGTFVHVCVEAFNLDKSVWGEDAWEFKPDRWDALPERVLDQPGIFSHLLTFSAGPRACTGMRLSLTEMKLLVFVLVANFVFKTHPDHAIVKVNKVLTRPQVVGKEEEGTQCPLIVSRFQRQIICD